MFAYIKKYKFIHKLCAVTLLALGSVISLTLISYQPTDPSFNVINTNLVNVGNWLGYYGAYIADILYQTFGIGAFILPPTFWVWGAILLQKGQIRWIILKIILIITAIITLCVTCANVPTDALPAGLGGYLGNLLLIFSTQYITINKSIVTWMYIVSFILFFLGLGLHPNLYINFFAQVAKIDFSFCKVLLPRFNRRVDPPEYVTIRKSPVINLNEDNNQISSSLSSDFEDTAEPISPPTNLSSVKKMTPRANHNCVNGNSEVILPDINLLNNPDKQTIKKESAEQLKRNADELLKVLKDFGIRGEIIDINQGPVVTLYEFEPAAGTKSSRVIGLADDIARSLSAISTRISVIPGRNVLGIELPNKHRAFFCLKELIETTEYKNTNILLPIILGKDLAGRPYVADLAKMPHLLVAGTTGSGKSVAINTMIMSLLYRYSPSDCRMIMIDPKMLELSIYDNIPHLLTPVVTEASKAIVALKWAVKEMENRYRLMSNIGVRNIAGYNAKIIEAKQLNKNLERTVHTGFDPETGKAIYDTVQIALEKLPFIVIIVDEMADLMIVAGKDIEGSIQRLAQMARAAGIHIIMATQRPSVDVITGVIKANFPSRISFKVTSKIDSRTILGEQGSEQLLGMGDMLYMGNSAKITRVHGPFVADSEVEKVTDYLKSLAVPEYITAVTENNDDEESSIIGDIEEGDDEALYRQAVEIVRKENKVSISYIQRCLRIGYNKSANIVEIMEKRGVVTPANHSGKRGVISRDKD